MKVILLKDVPNVGHKYEVKEVSDGYATNYLLARKLAEVATQGAVKSLELRRKQQAQQTKIDKDLLSKTLSALDGIAITISEKANEKGHLFSQVHKEEVIKALKDQKNIELEPEMIDLDKPIKEVGEHKISVTIDKKSVEINLSILPI
jgi:large subunit ribosomal protein L9